MWRRAITTAHPEPSAKVSQKNNNNNKKKTSKKTATFLGCVMWKVSSSISIQWRSQILSTNRINGYYRMYEWRAKARTIPCPCAGWPESVYFAHFVAWLSQLVLQRENDLVPYANSKGSDTPSPEVIKLFSCSTLLSTKFVLLINLKLLTIANYFLLNIAEHENFSANKYENANYCWHFQIY